MRKKQVVNANQLSILDYAETAQKILEEADSHREAVLAVRPPDCVFKIGKDNMLFAMEGSCHSVGLVKLSLLCQAGALAGGFNAYSGSVGVVDFVRSGREQEPFSRLEKTVLKWEFTPETTKTIDGLRRRFISRNVPLCVDSKGGDLIE